jgi:hypothetical protein
LCKEEQTDEESETSQKHSTARTLKKVIKHFLEGKPDPRWTNEFRQKVYSDKHNPERAQRARRFLEMLKTVDGVFSQRFLAFPHEQWTYEKYDVFVLKLIWELISDEFLDSEVSKYGRDLTTRFSELKKARKTFKFHAGRNTVCELANHELLNKKARWLRFFLPLWKEYEKETDVMRKTYLHGILSQTRGAGKPPPTVKLQAKEKFLLQSLVPDNTTSTELKLVATTMKELLDELPDHIFTGLRTKAGISVNSSACWEYNQAEHGTLRAIQDIVKGRSTGIKARKFDLETGEPDGFLEETASAGSYIFWRCLEEVLLMTPKLRAQAQLVVVDEPGKCRAVTKARACLKVVMDLVNKVCSVPLERGFESSKSGMGKANHSWNLFKDFENSPHRDILFKTVKYEKERFNGADKVTVEYQRLYAVSTDYENATDNQSHKIAKVIGYMWMSKCGIPRVLKNLVCEIAYTSREIFYFGNFGIGDPVDLDKNLWKINTLRGVLMGDPLTKVVLHFDNIVARRLAVRIFEEDFHSKAFGQNANSFESLCSALRANGIEIPK